MNSDTRATFAERLQKLTADTTQTRRRGGKALHALRFRDRLGELAAAFDGLAETLRERESPPKNNRAAVKDAAAWLATLARFNRALRACPDIASIDRVVVETVEEVFPTCIVALCFNDRSGAVTLIGRHDLTKEVLAAGAELETAGDPAVQTDSRTLPQNQAISRRLKGGSLIEEGWISYATVPMRAQEGVLGALSVYGPARRELGSFEVDFLTVIADQAALAVDKLRLVKQTVGQRLPLSRDTKELVTSSASNADFVSILSHEFRTPLNLITGYTEMMHEELMGKITPEQRMCLDRVMKASDDLLALVTNMLEVGAIESGCVEVNKGKVKVDQLLQEIRADFMLAEEKKIKLIWDIPADLPIVNTDADKLRVVLRQLIGNAIKFTERGHVTISGRSVLPAGKLEITVSDTGVGIPQHVLPVLFEKYRQLDSSIARSYDGIGLGLFIAKRLMEVLGGELNVTSRPGIGSTFAVVLPSGI